MKKPNEGLRAAKPADCAGATHFRQLPDKRHRAYAYLLADASRRQSILIDPSAGSTTLYLALLDELALQLDYVLITHLHRRSDCRGITELCQATSATAVAPAGCPIPSELRRLVAEDGGRLAFGGELVLCRSTPGHTAAAACYLWRDRLFAGDTLTLVGCPDPGETAEEDAGALYDSISRKLMALPDETLVYPGHDFGGRRVSCIGEAREASPQFTEIGRAHV